MSRAPALRGMLEKAQLLGHPRVVTMFVEKAHSMKLAGKL
jgi:hypothetical protein